ncbi:MAG TPA: murein biosynthesis integral membrane protein MurJ [Anaerolineae bacterium]|nr:murein biosynthesis integral membrane protein MurJ [Anaerolineae bacterium]
MPDTRLPATPSARNRRIVIAALLVGAGFLVSKFTGILDDLILARIIGPGRELDAYYAAFGLPDLLFTLVAGGALASAFIPVLSGLITRDRDTTWRLVSAVANLAFLVTLIFAVALAVFAPWVADQLYGCHLASVQQCLDEGRGFTPEQVALTADLMRVILLSTAIFSVSAILMSALQAHQHFLLPALAPIMYNLGILAGVILLAPRFGVWGPAFGVVLGALLHLLVQVPGLVRYGARWTPAFNLHDPHLRRVLALLAPRVGTLGVVYLAAIIRDSLASQLSPGSVTALNYGWRVMQLPETVIATAVATAVFPTLSELAALGQRDELRATLSSVLRTILALTVPATLGLLVLGRPFVRVLFEGGLFASSATDAVVWALHGYALGLIGHSLLEVSARTFYAQQDTRTPLYIAVGAMIVNVIASLLLREPLGPAGLALGNSIGVSLEVLVLLIIARRRLHGIDERRIFAALLRFTAGSLAMAAAMFVLQSAFSHWPLPDTLSIGGAIRPAIEIGIPLVAAGAVGLLVYIGVASAIGSDEVRALPRALLRRRPAA